MKNKNSSGGGMGLLSVLQVIFIVLKLVGVISWSWWTVLIPLWIWIGVVVLAAIALWALSKFD